jgi:hypothetical protein
MIGEGEGEVRRREDSRLSISDVVRRTSLHVMVYDWDRRS